LFQAFAFSFFCFAPDCRSALEVLPADQAIARVRAHAHWQTDVQAGFALGTGTGWLCPYA